MVTIVTWHGHPVTGTLIQPFRSALVATGVCPPTAVSVIQYVSTVPGPTLASALTLTRSPVAVAGSCTGGTVGGDSAAASSRGGWPRKPGSQDATFAYRTGWTASSSDWFAAPTYRSTTTALVPPGSIRSTIAPRSWPGGAWTVSTPSAPVWAAATRLMFCWPTV
jgi:hypothetical protein